MCGILGLISENITDENFYRFSNSLKLISRRGPDFTNIEKISINRLKVLFGHNRLSIVDLTENGNQPMYSASKQSIITFNGEIYNHLELRNKYLNKFSWKSSCDTETLLELLEKFSIKKILEQIRGMYSFAYLKDSNLYLVRDCFGEKPLYYSFYKNSFIFSSEIDPIKYLIGKDNLTINQTAINYLTKLSYIPAPFTIFNEIQKLSASSFIQIDLNKIKSYQKLNPNILEKKYWNLKKNEISNKNHNYSFYKKNTDILLKKSVQLQTLSDVPIGCFLSGGIDSSLITSFLTKIIEPKKINTFSIGFDFDKYNEAPYAKQIAKFLGTSHNELILNKKNITDELMILSNVYTEPFADSSQIPTLLLSKMTSNHVKVALTGDGGDETHAGYDRYLFAIKYWPILKLFPKQIRLNLFKILQFLPKKLITYFLINILKLKISGPTDNKIEKIIQKISHINSEFTFYQSLTNEWFNEEIVNDQTDKSIINENKFEELTKYSFEDAMMHADIVTYLTDDLLCKVDRASMYYSLETRAPFLDRDFVEYSFNIPSEFKIDSKNSKLILKDILNDYLPRKFFDRPKQGFGIPLYKWIREDLINYGEELLSKDVLNKHNYFNNKMVLKAWNDHKNGKVNNFNKLWPIIQFNLWYNNNYN